MRNTFVNMSFPPEPRLFHKIHYVDLEIIIGSVIILFSVYTICKLFCSSFCPSRCNHGL